MPKIIMEKSKVASHFTLKKIKSMKNVLVYSHDRSTSCTSIEIQLWSCTWQNSHKISTKRTKIVITRATLLFITMLKAQWTCTDKTYTQHLQKTNLSNIAWKEKRSINITCKT